MIDRGNAPGAHPKQSPALKGRNTHPAGMTAPSRWLSSARATPPEPHTPQNRTPHEVPACNRWLSNATPPDCRTQPKIRPPHRPTAPATPPDSRTKPNTNPRPSPSIPVHPRPSPSIPVHPVVSPTRPLHPARWFSNASATPKPHNRTARPTLKTGIRPSIRTSTAPRFSSITATAIPLR